MSQSTTEALTNVLSDSEASYLDDFLNRSADTMRDFADSSTCKNCLAEIAQTISASLHRGGKLLVAGNGGSAADAQHSAGEFTARLMYDRRPLAAIALTTDSSAMTAISNDYGYDHVFSRQVAALGRPGDVFIGITTSGRSPNIVRALAEARAHGLTTVVFMGDNGVVVDNCDIAFRAPSDWTPLIQQIHITAAHVVCALVERELCPQSGHTASI